MLQSMPVVKTKAGYEKKKFLGRRTKTRAYRKNVTHISSAKLAGDIEKLTAELGKNLKGQILKIAPKKGRHTFGFKVIVDNGSISVETAKIAAGSINKQEFDPFEAGRKAVEQMQAAEGGAWTGAELESHFGLTPANLHKRRTEHRIVWWRDAKNQFHYPKWQFNHAGAPLNGMQEVLQTFRSSDEWRVMRYFLGPRNQLADRTPLDLLRAGEVEKVIAHAKVHAEENTW